jgi:hypothetical protein
VEHRILGRVLALGALQGAEEAGTAGHGLAGRDDVDFDFDLGPAFEQVLLSINPVAGPGTGEHGHTLAVTVNGVDVSNHCSQATIETKFDDVDFTAFGSIYKQIAQGLGDATITLSLFQDYAAGSVDAPAGDALEDVDDVPETALRVVRVEHAAGNLRITQIQS